MLIEWKTSFALRLLHHPYWVTLFESLCFLSDAKKQRSSCVVGWNHHAYSMTAPHSGQTLFNCHLKSISSSFCFITLIGWIMMLIEWNEIPLTLIEYPIMLILSETIMLVEWSVWAMHIRCIFTAFETINTVIIRFRWAITHIGVITFTQWIRIASQIHVRTWIYTLTWRLFCTSSNTCCHLFRWANSKPCLSGFYNGCTYRHLIFKVSTDGIVTRCRDRWSDEVDRQVDSWIDW